MLPMNPGFLRRWSAALALLAAATTPHAFAQPFEQVSVGAEHICALDAAGNVECTASAIAQRLLPPDALPPMQDIAAGQQHTCGITLDGRILCWGTDVFGVLDAPAFDAPISSIVSGFNHSCAVDVNDRVQCWGLNSNGQLDVPNVAGGFVKVDVARTASCGIDTRGDIRCWSTDSFFNPGTPIPGPFIDLDLDSNQACGLTAAGDIECWAERERQNLAPPTNGPYTDLTVTGSAICGLRTDRLLDCSFAAPTVFELDAREEDYPLDVPFSSIERSALQFGGVPICGIRAENGTIGCFGGSGNDGSLPAPPGAPQVDGPVTADRISLGLTAQVYGRNQVELFWNELPVVFPRLFVEVYRDDRLLTTTGNNFSYYDNDGSIVSDASRYRVRTVDEAGNVGAFSNAVRVDRSARRAEIEQDIGTNPRMADLRVRDVSVERFLPFLENVGSYIMMWNVDNTAGVAIAGFEVRVNDEPVGFVGDNFFIGDGVTRDACRVYSVAAIADDGTILDYGSAALGRRCPNRSQ